MSTGSSTIKSTTSLLLLRTPTSWWVFQFQNLRQLILRNSRTPKDFPSHAHVILPLILKVAQGNYFLGGYLIEDKDGVLRKALGIVLKEIGLKVVVSVWYLDYQTIVCKPSESVETSYAIVPFFLFTCGASWLPKYAQILNQSFAK